MDRWDFLMIAVAAYVAVTSLTRLMAYRRNQLVTQVRQQVAQQQKTKPRKTKNDTQRGSA